MRSEKQNVKNLPRNLEEVSQGDGGEEYTLREPQFLPFSITHSFYAEVLPITKRKSREDREKSENIYYVQHMNERIANKLCVQVPFNPELNNDVQVGSAKSEGNEATNIGYVAVRWSYIEEILKEKTKDLKSALSKLPGDMENLTDESTGSIQSANGFYTELGLQSMANSTLARWRSGKETWQPPSGKLHRNTKDLETKRVSLWWGKYAQLPKQHKNSNRPRSQLQNRKSKRRLPKCYHSVTRF